MIFFKDQKVYARVWEIKPSEDNKRLTLEVSTSETDKDGTRVYSRWYPRICGGALEKLKDLKSGDTIIITKAKLTNTRKQNEDGTAKYYFNFYVFDAEIAPKDAPGDRKRDDGQRQAKPAQPKPAPAKPAPPIIDDEDDPW